MRKCDSCLCNSLDELVVVCCFWLLDDQFFSGGLFLPSNLNHMSRVGCFCPLNTMSDKSAPAMPEVARRTMNSTGNSHYPFSVQTLPIKSVSAKLQSTRDFPFSWGLCFVNSYHNSF